MDAPSIAAVPEHELVDLLFEHPFFVDLAVPPDQAHDFVGVLR